MSTQALEPAPPRGASVDARSALALRVRERVIRLATDGGCFIGASLSCVDLLVHLYTSVLRIGPSTLSSPERDYLFFSKGHAVPALYGTLAELGFFPAARLDNHLEAADAVYWHPNRTIPGVELHSGSLGHLPAVALGVALDVQLAGGRNRVFVLVGDGELNEGSVWEALLVAGARRLENLVLVIDRNGLQANVRTEELVPLEPLAAKLEAFGWATAEVDGHDFAALDRAFRRVQPAKGLPTAVIARTTRGKGLPSIEERADRWFANFTPQEIEMLVAELHGAPPVRPVRDPEVVR